MENTGEGIQERHEYASSFSSLSSCAVKSNFFLENSSMWSPETILGEKRKKKSNWISYTIDMKLLIEVNKHASTVTNKAKTKDLTYMARSRQILDSINLKSLNKSRFNQPWCFIFNWNHNSTCNNTLGNNHKSLEFRHCIYVEEERISTTHDIKERGSKRRSLLVAKQKWTVGIGNRLPGSRSEGFQI